MHLTTNIHGIGVDAGPGNAYSVPILGKLLVIIANPVQHSTPTRFLVSSPGLYTELKPKPTVMSVLTDLTGGHFSA